MTLGIILLPILIKYVCRDRIALHSLLSTNTNLVVVYSLSVMKDNYYVCSIFIPHLSTDSLEVGLNISVLLTQKITCSCYLGMEIKRIYINYYTIIVGI